MTYNSPFFVTTSRIDGVAPTKYATIGDEGYADTLQQRSSCVVVASFPFFEPATFDPLYTEGKKASVPFVNASSSWPSPIDLTETVKSVRVSSSKASPVWECEVDFDGFPKNNLKNDSPSLNNWFTSPYFAKGDWIAVWMFDNQQDANLVKQALQDPLLGRSLTAWRSGLKFLGRIKNIAPSSSTSPEGLPAVQIKMVAAMDIWESPISLHPMMLTQMSAQAGQFAQEILAIAPLSAINPQDGTVKAPVASVPSKDYWGAKLLDFFAGEDVALVPPNKAINFILDGTLCFGIYGETVQPPIDLTTVASPTTLMANPELPPLTPWKPPYLPESIKNMLSPQSFPLVIDTWGNGTYKPVAPVTPAFPVDNTFGLCMAREIGQGFDHELVGSTLLMQGYFGGDDLWTCLSRFANTPVNEIFFSLRPQPVMSDIGDILTDGPPPEQWNILPTIVARQLPFSSGILKSFIQNTPALPNKPKLPNVYSLKDLRHWMIHPVFVKSVSLSKDKPIINFLQISGNDIRLAVANQDPYKAMKDLYNPPVIDPISVARHGVKEYITEVSGIQTFLYQGRPNDFIDPSFFTRMMADIKFREHRYFDGQISSHLIQEPICIGDNICIKGDVNNASYYYNGFVGHIVSITHQFQISDDGVVYSETAIGVEWGAFSADDSYDDILYPAQEEGH